MDIPHKTMKSNRWFILTAICFILAMLTLAAKAQAAGPATNVVTLTWTAPTNNTVPFVYEMQQTLSLTTPAWVTIAANIPSNVVFLTLNVDRDMKFFRMRSVNSTNSAWVSDFSNVASTAWPAPGGNLGIRLGP